jgi:hypothetical protein
MKPFDTLNRIKPLSTDENYLMKKFNPVGWMCAQKRPLDALHSLLQQYQQVKTSLSDYLFIIDDDTWVNIDAIVPFIVKEYPSTGAHAVAVCLARMRKVNSLLLTEDGARFLLDPH